jgi:hypothetical protein
MRTEIQDDTRYNNSIEGETSIHGLEFITYLHQI